MSYVLDGEQSDSDYDDEDSSPSVVPEPPVATAAEAHKSLAHALTWLETQDIDSVKLMQLRSLMAFAKRAELESKKKQCKLTDFFKRT